jgi:hypothetical protein
MGITRAFLTASGIGVRHLRIIWRRVVPNLFFPENNAVFHIEIKVAGTLIPTIGYVRGLHHPVPIEGPFPQDAEVIAEAVR